MSQTLTMNNGMEIPTVALGTWNSRDNEVGGAVEAALKAGYRHLDCAFLYGNEAEIGAALKNITPKLNLQRSDVFITSKLWCTFMRPELVKKACEKTISDLGVEYLDSYLIHGPTAFIPGNDFFPKDASGKLLLDNVALENTWKEMEKLVDEGLVKSIGLSNFNRRQIELILSHCRIKPTVLQVESHLNFPNNQLIEYAKSMGIVVTAYAPLGSPAASPGKTNALQDPQVLKLAEKYKKTPAQILLRYSLQRGLVVAPKSVTSSRIVENFQVFDFNLTQEEMEQLSTCGMGERQFKLLATDSHPEYPFKDEY